jgi:hexosaminidase
VFDLYDEVIDVFNPKTIHIGHDEWWVMCVCDRCKGKDPARLFADNVIKCYNYLKERGVKTMMWSDKTIRTYEKTGEAQGGCEKHLYSLKTDELVDVLGEKYNVYKRFWNADLAPEEAKRDGFHQIILDTADCMDMLPKDIIHVNWLWACEPQINDDFLKRNLEMVYGNLDMTGLWDCKERFALGAKGISISNWIESDEKGFQHWDALFMLAYGATQCWGHTRKPFEYERIVFDAFEQLYRFRNREILKGKYLEVVHTTEDSGAEGKKFYETPYVPDKDMYLGKYVVSYTDNTTEEIPVLYAHNISCRDASTDWYSSPRFWGFLTDNRLTVAISVCNIEKRPDGIWYKAVFPVKGEIASCKYVPCDGGEDFVTVDKMTYKNAETGEEKPF